MQNGNCNLLADYTRGPILGRGSSGVAFLVRPTTCPERQLVAKEMCIINVDEKRRREALAESQFLRDLSHQNIIICHDVFQDTNMLYIVMEYADGGDLGRWIQNRRNENRRLPEQTVMSAFVQICSALNYIHSKKILHRDLKPANIFIMGDGELMDCTIKLGDFGIAKMIDGSMGQAVSTVGTPSYLSPEICRNNPYGMKADIWSLGVVLYELLCLKVPFHAGNLPAMALMICSDEPKRIPEEYCDDLADLVFMLLRKEPKERPHVSAVLALPYVQGVLDNTSGASSTTGAAQSNGVPEKRDRASNEAMPDVQPANSRASRMSRGSDSGVCRFPSNGPGGRPRPDRFPLVEDPTGHWCWPIRDIQASERRVSEKLQRPGQRSDRSRGDRLDQIDPRRDHADLASTGDSQNEMGDRHEHRGVERIDRELRGKRHDRGADRVLERNVRQANGNDAQGAGAQRSIRNGRSGRGGLDDVRMGSASNLPLPFHRNLPAEGDVDTDRGDAPPAETDHAEVALRDVSSTPRKGTSEINLEATLPPDHELAAWTEEELKMSGKTVGLGSHAGTFSFSSTVLPVEQPVLHSTIPLPASASPPVLSHFAARSASPTRSAPSAPPSLAELPVPLTLRASGSAASLPPLPKILATRPHVPRSRSVVSLQESREHTKGVLSDSKENAGKGYNNNESFQPNQRGGLNFLRGQMPLPVPATTADCIGNNSSQSPLPSLASTLQSSQPAIGQRHGFREDSSNAVRLAPMLPLALSGQASRAGSDVDAKNPPVRHSVV